MSLPSRFVPLARRLVPAAFCGGLLVALVVGGAAPAEAAVVYCTGPGIPVGCVVRPTPYAAPAARAAVACTRPGYPVGCTAGANVNARAVARPGPGVNVNGGVNRAGVR